MPRTPSNPILLAVVGVIGLSAILVGVVVLKFGLSVIGLSVIGDVPTEDTSNLAGWAMIITGIASNIAIVVVSFFRVNRLPV